MDVTTDGFGFMLSIGDLTWVPFTYSLQARYLAFHQVDLGLTGTVSIAALQLLGYYIFRVSNVEKNEFRKGNNPKSLSIHFRPMLTMQACRSCTPSVEQNF
jgi:delta14-sterol reductase